MSIENEVFLKKKADIKKLLPYGFMEQNDAYVLEKDLPGTGMQAILRIQEGKIIGKVYDPFAEEEYIAFRLQENLGSFAAKVKDAYVTLLEEIREQCFYDVPYIYDQTNRIVDWIEQEYRIVPDHPFAKEESYDVERGKVTSAWYGVDNSSEVFEPGSRLCVRWINKQENPQEWNTYNPMIDESETQNIPDFKKWLFIAEVIHPDGVTKYTVLPNSVPFYVQLGDDWDVEDVEARFISPNEDESVRTTYIRSLSYPAGTDEFMKLDLLHFSPYVIYDKDNPSNNNEIKTEEQPGNSIDNKGENKTNNGYIIFVIVGSGTGIAALALLWWWLHKKKKRRNKLIANSIIAEFARKKAKLK